MSLTTLPLSMPSDRMVNQVSAQQEHTAAVHPMQASLKSFDEREEKRKNFTMAHVFGSAMPMNLQLEREAVSHPLRLPSLQSSKLGLDVLQDDLVNFDFKDYLNVPEMREDINVDLHAQMENKLGIKVKLQF